MGIAVRIKLSSLLLLALSWLSAPPAHAEAPISTIYLTNGGMVRGEIVVDIPGAPLTVMVGGQSIQVPRESIGRIDAPVASTQSVPLAAPIAAPIVQPVVAAPPVVPAAPALAPPAANGAVVLQVDRRGRAAIQNDWSPELQQLVLRRNDLAYSMKRKGLGAPIAMLSVGAIGIIGTAIGATVASNSYESCVQDNASSYTFASGCSNSAGVVMAVGYSLSSAIFAGGGTFLLVRLLRRKILKRQLALVDQDLRRFNVAPLAQLSPQTNGAIRVAGLRLRASF